MKFGFSIAALVVVGLSAHAEEPMKLVNVAYGKHPRQVLDLYQAKSSKPTPVVFNIHGGGWRGGDKNLALVKVQPFLDKGISVVSINYRLIKAGDEDALVPPVKAPLEDAARALQFVRSKAEEWNLDKERIGATGGSAGACSSLWLAFHDDMADPKSADPVARESTRLTCAAVNGAQTSLDPQQTREWMPNYSYGAHAFGMSNLDEVLKDREKVMPWIKEYSPIELADKSDPPVGLYYNGDANSKKGDSPKDATHSPLLGMLLTETMKEKGMDVILAYPGHTNAKYKDSTAYLIDHLSK